MITLWNPSTRMFKFVELSSNSKQNKQLVSVGTADTGNDFLVVRLIFSTNKREIEILSVNSRHSEWIHKESEVPLELEHKSSSDVVFNREPYWIAMRYGWQRDRAPRDGPESVIPEKN
ncbi:hypothetical protein KY290_014292 [Solanum tuberosum]|uniref:Uncharacterized protein n=1 Tax=Solanum tuberosum TaxID=4113 RepID=A0ABQ7VQF7_SOLTU|nr:hypothetical protein KY289_014355 [Solanum tuberosum]KAH0699477.1 hypothetical protein KY284_013692 [Solanum tuberosum]KAH0770311.1 hypothetical protein KY290_014292 [Solanum tuberosum]